MIMKDGCGVLVEELEGVLVSLPMQYYKTELAECLHYHDRYRMRWYRVGGELGKIVGLGNQDHPTENEHNDNLSAHSSCRRGT